MSIVRPAASIRTESAGGAPLGTAGAALNTGALDLAEAAVTSLAVDLSVFRDHDRIELSLSHQSPLAEIEPGTTLVVGLGAGDDPNDVLAAEVRRVDVRPESVSVVALAPSHRLSATHIGKTYLRQTAGDITNDLLDEAGVEAGEVDAPRDLPVYHVDGRISVWVNLHRLAEKVGATITSTATGAVSCKPSPGADAGGLGGALAGAAAAVPSLPGLGGGEELRRGADLLRWQTGPRRAGAVATPSVAPLGAASPFGADRAHHLLKNPDGDSPSGPTIVDPTLRDTASADGAAQNLSSAATRAMAGGRLVVPGDPTLRAGTVVATEDASWHVLSVRHRMNRNDGYVSCLVVEGTA